MPLPSSHRFGRSNGSLCRCFVGPLERPAEGGVERQLLAVDLVALHDAERQPQGERRVRGDALAETSNRSLGDLRVRLPLRLLDLGPRSACAARGRSASIGRASRIIGSVLASIGRLARPRPAASARPGRPASCRRPVRRPAPPGLAGEDTSTSRVLAAELLGQERQRRRRASPAPGRGRSGPGENSWNLSDSRFESRYSRSRSAFGFGSSSASRTQCRAMWNRSRVERVRRSRAGCTPSRSWRRRVCTSAIRSHGVVVGLALRLRAGRRRRSAERRARSAASLLRHDLSGRAAPGTGRRTPCGRWRRGAGRSRPAARFSGPLLAVLQSAAASSARSRASVYGSVTSRRCFSLASVSSRLVVPGWPVTNTRSPSVGPGLAPLEVVRRSWPGLPSS